MRSRIFFRFVTVIGFIHTIFGYICLKSLYGTLFIHYQHGLGYAFRMNFKNCLAHAVYQITHTDNPVVPVRVFGLKGRNGSCSFKIMTLVGGRWYGVSINVRYRAGRGHVQEVRAVPSSSPSRYYLARFPYRVTYCFYSTLSGC